jgi:hypothetical protein
VCETARETAAGTGVRTSRYWKAPFFLSVELHVGGVYIRAEQLACCLAAAVGGGPATAVAPFQHNVISVLPVFPAAWRDAAVAVLGVESLQSW